jgi:hypothetical protein
MSIKQPESSDGGRRIIPRDKTLSPAHDHAPPDPVEASATVLLRVGSCQPRSQQHDSRPVIVPHADGYVYFI